MIDHLIRFDSEDDAKADAIVGAYCIDDAWRVDVCFPGQVVRQNSTGEPLPYWYITISTPSIVPELRDHPTCMVVWDRDAGHSIFSRVEAMGDYVIEPVPAGSDYPFGSAPMPGNSVQI